MTGLKIGVFFTVADQHKMLSIAIFVIVESILQILIRADTKTEVAIDPIDGDYNTIPFAVCNGFCYTTVSTDTFGERFDFFQHVIPPQNMT